MRDREAEEQYGRTRLTASEVDALYLEGVVSLQCATGSAAPIQVFAEIDPKHRRGFVAMELGMAFQQGPAFTDVQRTLRADNRRRLKDLRSDEDGLVKAFQTYAKEHKLRTRVRTAAQCTGCGSCSYARTVRRPEGRAEIPRRTPDWVPRSGAKNTRRASARTKGSLRRELRGQLKYVGLEVQSGSIVRTGE